MWPSATARSTSESARAPARPARGVALHISLGKRRLSTCDASYAVAPRRDPKKTEEAAVFPCHYLLTMLSEFLSPRSGWAPVQGLPQTGEFCKVFGCRGGGWVWKPFEDVALADSFVLTCQESAEEGWAGGGRSTTSRASVSCVRERVCVSA